ncbi:MAG: plastocyanin/azurin family copper-binding protein [Melioribacteraceae bacterium]|nr:plastocyanin/azurin family copper-binding protein [Melioribacteraceae bacterium]
MIKINKLVTFIISLVLIASCGGDVKKDSTQTTESKIAEFHLTANDQMKFNLKNMVVKEGDLVKIKFTNVGRMAKDVMGHNFVLLKSNVDPAQFATKALSFKENEYIPEDEIDNIIIHSKLLGPGEEVIVEFNAPSKGIYKYICSFPGHYISMQGSLIVR